MWLLILLMGATAEAVMNSTSKFTIDELLTSSFPRKISNDIDLDPCKADGFYGDIVVPNVIYDLELKTQKLNQTYHEEIEKYKKEMLLERVEAEEEGLQIEEEGLVEVHKAKQLHDERTKVKENDFKKKNENVENSVRKLSNAHSRSENRRGLFMVRKPKRPPIVLDDDFDQIEPKYDPNFHMDDDDEPSAEDTTETWKTRLHKERKRRIQHTGDPTTVERKEMVNKQNTSHKDDSTTPVENATENVQVSVNSVEKPHEEYQVKSSRKAKKWRESNGRKNSKRMNSREKDVLVADENKAEGGGENLLDDGFPDEMELLRRHENQTKRKKRRKKQDKRVTTVSSDSRKRVARAATARKERVWDYGVIPYEIDGNFSGAHKALFKQAMRHWENATCVKFVERNPLDHPNYIFFTERSCGCCSFVGKRGNGPQAISIGKNCDKFGIVVHELGHVVGFWHEHTRPDRDRHVDIVRDHIMEGQEYNFNKLNDEEVNSLGLGYDYDSIMHYARNTFSKGTYLDTIQPLDKIGNKRPEIGQRIRLSAGDIAQTNLLYKCADCGRTYQENSASFAHPATLHGSGVRCEWRITATHGEKIVLNITELDIHRSENCRTDYLEIRDGYWQKSPVIGKLCGKRKASDGSIISSGARLTITLVTTARSVNNKGFAASYEAVCGGDIFLTEQKGHLESPNFPEDYQPSKECTWNLKVQDGYQIALKFLTFEVENHDNCVYDYVEVRDGHGLSAPVIGTYCGYKLPNDIRSTGNTLSVKFVSDGSVQKAGFSASFILEQDECSAPDVERCEQICTNILGGYECSCRIGYELHSDGFHCENACGGVIEALNGTLTSPSFPEVYPRNKRCIWELVAPPQYKITLNFTHFDFEGNNFMPHECEFDKVEVHSKIGDDFLRRHGVYCGTRSPPLITSESNVLRIEFTSDGTVERSGFAAVFFTDIDECAVDNGGCQHECQNTIGSFVCSCFNGFNLHDNGRDCKEGGCKFEITAPYGQIQSPNYPDYYPSKKDCVWHFTTTPGHRIRLTFTQFEMEPHQECAYDHIVIYDGDSPDSHTLGRFCGAKIPHPISATGNQMYMAFKSDASVQRRGFHATHATVCGGHLQATSQTKHFYSHAKYGDHNYGNRMDCDWSIEAAPGRRVHLVFLVFELEEEQNCSYDYVEVFSGLDASGPHYGKFCSNTNPSEFISLYEALVVRFRTDDTIVSKGFSASYVAYDPADSDEVAEKLLKSQDEDY